MIPNHPSPSFQLAKKLAYSDEVQANVLEVKAIPGLGTTIDVVLVNGTLKEGNTMIVAGTDGPIVTPIKALLTPSKMQASHGRGRGHGHTY